MRWVAALLLLAGCKSTERLETDAPDSLRFVAIVEVDEDGAFVEGYLEHLKTTFPTNLSLIHI